MVGLATVFGAGGGTSSYAEIEDTDVIVMWGSNARDAHPIFFHHVLQGVRNGAKLYVVDPRRSSTAQFADVWLGLEVGTDVALSNTIAREIIHAGLVNTVFIERGTTGFAEYAASVEEWTLERGSQVTGVPVEAIRELAHAYARADRAQICWTLGITEHHNGVDNVLALINLSLLVRARRPLGRRAQPACAARTTCRAAATWAPSRPSCPASRTSRTPWPGPSSRPSGAPRSRPRTAGTSPRCSRPWRAATLRGLFVIGENPAQSEADVHHSIQLLRDLDHLVVQDIFLTKTAELADVVLPGSASWCEANGTVTNSERRVQLVRKALDPPGDARDDIEILLAIAANLGHEWTYGSAEEIWDELRSLSPMHAGMSYARLAELGGIQWPCYSEDRLEPSFLHGRLWADDPADRGRLAPFSVVIDDPPVDLLDDEFPLRLTTGRRLDSYNTGVQSGGFQSPLRFGETIDVSPEDAERLHLDDGEMVRVVSRRGAVEAPVRIDDTLRPGLVFMTFHFPDEIQTNLLTIDATDPKSGTAEFKAAAVRIDKIADRVPSAAD